MPRRAPPENLLVDVAGAPGAATQSERWRPASIRVSAHKRVNTVPRLVFYLRVRELGLTGKRCEGALPLPLENPVKTQWCC